MRNSRPRQKVMYLPPCLCLPSVQSAPPRFDIRACFHVHASPGKPDRAHVTKGMPVKKAVTVTVHVDIKFWKPCYLWNRLYTSRNSLLAHPQQPPEVLPCKPSAQLIRSFGHPATKPYGNSRADAGRGSSNLKKKQGKTKCETRLKLCSSCKSPGHSFADNLIASVHVQGMGNPYENKYFQIALRLNRHSGETEPMRNCASN